MAMKLHPRFKLVKAAQIDLDEAISAAIQVYELTPMELIKLLSSAILEVTTDGIRLERHGTTDKKGDEA